jgi:O-antigen biosynthesis protein
MTRVAVVIVNYNLADDVGRLIGSIRKHTRDVDYRIYVVDNGSIEPGFDRLRRDYPDVEYIVLEHNRGFGAGNNAALRLAEADTYFLLNPDALLVENSIKKTIDFMTERPEYGIVGHRQVYEDGSVQETARSFPSLVEEFFALFGLNERLFRLRKRLRRVFFDKPHYRTDFVYGSCMAIRREVVEATGGFDEDFFLFAEETDLCYRALRAGYPTGFFRDAVMIHAAGKVTAKVKSDRVRRIFESKLLFVKKHYGAGRRFLFRALVRLQLALRRSSLPLAVERDKRDEFKRVYRELGEIYRRDDPPVNPTLNSDEKQA